MTEETYEQIKKKWNKENKQIAESIIIEAINNLRFEKVEKAFDRNYIQHYINLCREQKLITGNILEFGGSGILYSNPKKEKVTICTGMKDQAEDATVQFDILKKYTISSKMLFSFDTIICTQVLNYMLDPITALHNLKLLLKPNGMLILTVSGPLYRDRNAEGFKTFWTERGVKDMCKKVFEEENISNLKVYGTFSSAINAILGLEADDEINENKTDFNVITGICCKNSYPNV
jgi:2-polyprenyl-3-methyl-5-hydroxy-6-metoxy-1,4-benzoquinol methylase